MNKTQYDAPTTRTPDQIIEAGYTKAAAKLTAMESQLSQVRSQAHRDFDRAHMADEYERWLLDIGKLCGCGHLDERLPRCIEQEFEKLQDENAIMRESLKLARLTDEKLEALKAKLRSFANEHVCPVNENCQPGFVSGAFSAWGWARNHVTKLLEEI